MNGLESDREIERHRNNDEMLGTKENDSMVMDPKFSPFGSDKCVYGFFTSFIAKISRR